jgi:peptide deformylase
MKPVAVINPKILSYSQEIYEDWEGCLSIPGIRGLVPRSRSISVEFHDRTGKLCRKKFKDLIARIFQHEFDHLNGTVFVDRMASSRNLITEKEYQRMIKNKKKLSG